MKLLKHVMQALVLASLVTSAHAVTDISTCQTITLRGAYRLTQNLESGYYCIVIVSSNVTLDLQGHTINGNRTPYSQGIHVPSGTRVQDIVVRNGTVAFFEVGVNLAAATHGVRVENMNVHSNKLGMRVGSGAVVASNIVHDNDFTGIVVSGDGENGALVANNLLYDNKGHGIRVDEAGSAVIGNVARRNGADGIFVVCPANVQNNVATLQQSTSGVDLRLVTTGCLDVNNVAPKKKFGF